MVSILKFLSEPEEPSKYETIGGRRCFKSLKFETERAGKDEKTSEPYQITRKDMGMTFLLVIVEAFGMVLKILGSRKNKNKNKSKNKIKRPQALWIFQAIN